MEADLGSFKVLENVRLKSTYNMRIGERDIEPGETIAHFDKISISNFNEIKDIVAARGGFGNRAHVFWETTKEIQLTFSQGVFSSTQFALLTNAKLFKVELDEPILITFTEKVETNEEGRFYTKKEVYDEFFVYDELTGEKYNPYFTNDSYIISNHPYTNLILTYRYVYNKGATIIRIGERLFNGFVELEGITRVKDDTSGLVTTGIIRIPKLKLMSGLSIRLGAQANPVVGNFQAVGVPVDSRYNSYVMEFDFLNNDIDSDM